MQQPANIDELTNAFERLEVRVGEVEDRQDRIVDDVNHNFAVIFGRVNNFIQEVRNCVAGAPASAVVNQPGAPAPFVNQPGAFPRPAGASGKNGFMQECHNWAAKHVKIYDASPVKS